MESVAEVRGSVEVSGEDRVWAGPECAAWLPLCPWLGSLVASHVTWPPFAPRSEHLTLCLNSWESLSSKASGTVLYLILLLAVCKEDV